MIVLDTHIWLWFVSDNGHRMPSGWKSAIESADRVGIAAISCYEVALAHKKGRLELKLDLESWLSKATLLAGIEQLPVTPDIAYRAVNLSQVHRDPFDRLIIATALVHDAKLASVDRLFSQYAELQDCLMTASG